MRELHLSNNLMTKRIKQVVDVILYFFGLLIVFMNVLSYLDFCLVYGVFEIFDVVCRYFFELMRLLLAVTPLTRVLEIMNILFCINLEYP